MKFLSTGFLKKPKPGKYTNRKGTNFTVDHHGRVSIDDVGELLKSSKIQEHLPVTDFFTADEIVRQYGKT